MKTESWFAPFISPSDDFQTWQRGYKMGVALALKLPANSFLGLSFERWKEFSQAYKQNTGEIEFPYLDISR